jgi:protein O-mannosyl-transferase
MIKKTIRTKKPKTKYLTLTGILLFTVIVFSGTLKNEILYGWDDGEYIRDESIQNLDVNAFFSNYYLGMYQPLAVLSLSLNHQSAGSNPAPYHTTNLLIHLINVMLVFYLFHRMTKRLEVAAIVAFLFAIHPMHVEGVAWIATRSNALYAAFYLAASLSYIIYLEKRSVSFLLLTLLFFVLSCFSKSMAITLPLLMILFDYVYNRPFDRKAVLEKIPFLLISVIFGVVAILAASQFGHIRNLAVTYHLTDRLVLSGYAVTFYLARAIVPVNLSAVYAYPGKTGDWFATEYYLAIIPLLLLIFFVIRSGKYRKELLFGLGFFLVTISVVLPLVWSRMLMLADRYTYIPYIGIFYLLTLLYNKIKDERGVTMRKYKPFIYAALLFYGVFLSVTSYQRIKVWKDAPTMITDVIEKNRSDIDVAIGYFFRGNIRDLSQDMQGALNDFSRAIELNPAYTMAYNNRGIIRGSLQDFEGALEDFNKAAELEPGYADAIYNRGNVHYYLELFNEACSDWSQAELLGSKQAGVIRRKYCR